MAIAHLTIATRDVSATCRFFQETLFWQPLHVPNNVDRAAAWLQIAPHQQLHIVEVKDFAASPFEAEFGRHVAIEWPVSKYEELKSRLVSHGAVLVDPLRETPFLRFFFRDPNGYLFEVVPALDSSTSD